MKVDIRPIIRDHFASIERGNGNKRPYFDYLIFFGLPIAMGILAFYQKVELGRDSYNASITFFGIFIALLLNIQMAMFSIYQRKTDIPEDDVMVIVHSEQVELRRQLLEELNSNASYLILVCCVALVMCLSSYVFEIEWVLMSSVTIVIYSHFLLTMLMVVKRTHALFQREYVRDVS